MKTTIFAVLLALSTATSVTAAELSTPYMNLCQETKESAVAMDGAKNRGVSKSEIYKIIFNSELAKDKKDFQYYLADAVYGGNSPDDLFDLCIDLVRKTGDKSKSKTERVGI